MTIITKAIGEKKPADKMEQPLVVDDIPTSNAEADPEAQRPQRGYVGMTIKDQVFILRRPNLRPNSLTLYCLLFTAILGMSIGVIGGLYIYRHYARDQMHRFRTGWYSIPYEGSNRSPIDREGLIAGRDSISNFFKERFEIDLENEHYEKIEVPRFRAGREGRFIHDFNNNLTGIIDINGRCCFVMPLNRTEILPPRNLADLLIKMKNGYYDVSTEVVRKTMRATILSSEDKSSVGDYIRMECENVPIYRLEKVNSTGTVKRSASDVVFEQFAGENIIEYQIENFDDK